MHNLDEEWGWQGEREEIRCHEAANQVGILCLNEKHTITELESLRHYLDMLI